MSVLKEEIGVAMSGVKWDSGNFKLWQSTKDDIILFAPRQPSLAKGQNGRYQFGVTQFREQTEDTYKITGGSAIFTVTSAIQFELEELERLKKEWESEGRANHGNKIPKNPRFIPLNVRKGQATVLINERSGTPDEAHNDKDIGTPGGTNSFLVSLTELGAQEWVQGIEEKSIIPAGVKMTYEYLRMLPTIGATVKIHSRRVYTHLSTSLNVSVGIGPFGTSAQIDAAWERMIRNGDVEITFTGMGLAPELEEIRNELTMTFAEQAKESLFNSLFEPMPEVKEAEAGNAKGRLWGANFAMKWKKVEDVSDLEQTINFDGWTWLKASMDVDLVSLIADLDSSYYTVVNTQVSAPTQVVIDADDLLESSHVSWRASEGAIPSTTSFGVTGGSAENIVTSQEINDIEVLVDIGVNFEPSDWPIISFSTMQKIGEGGNQIIVKPSSWVNRHWVYMFVKEGNNIKPPSEDDYLICNVSYEGDHLTRPINASSRITPLTPLQFSYPLSPKRASGTAKFSAFGVVDGRLVRSTEQVINLDEEAVFILADGNNLSLVSQNSVFPESMSDDSLEKRLLRSGAKPLIISSGESRGSESETDLQDDLNEEGIPPRITSHEDMIIGTVTGYGLASRDDLPHILVQSNEASSKRTGWDEASNIDDVFIGKTIYLQDPKHNEVFEKLAIEGKRCYVKVKVDDANVAADIDIILPQID